jgi:hypothetical protein
MERTVDARRDPDREPAHAALEACRVVGLHQQVQMIVLDAEFEHAKPGIRCQTERALDRDERALLAQRGEIRDRA